jgi:type I restriction enzyme S subunit
MSTSTLSEVVKAWGGLIQTGPFGSQLHQHDYSDQGVPVVMPKDIRNGRVDESGIARIPEGKARQLSRHSLKAGSVVFPRRGEISKCAYINEEQAGFLCGTGCIKIEPPEEKLRSKFLFYFLGLRQSVEWLERNAVGTTMLNLNTKILGGLNIPLLAPKKQDKIVDTLSAYDDLIENNRRRIQLLEQAARLLYKEWFVHLRFPGHEHTQIIDGVPEGWEKGVVSDFYDTASGGTPSRKTPEFYSGDINWVKTQELQDGFLFDTEEHITEDAIKKSAAKLFPANTVLIAMYGATIGQVGVIVDPSTCNQACCAVMPKAEGTNYEHAFLFFLSNKEGLRNLGQGAAQKNISQQVIRGYDMILPDKLTLKLFRDYAATFLGQIRTLQAMNQQLAKARDLLLPKLMNGEVAV